MMLNSRITGLTFLMCAWMGCAMGSGEVEASLQWRLSRYFSEVYVTNGNAVALRMMDRKLMPLVQALGREEGGAGRGVKAGEVFVLTNGDGLNFGVPDSGTRLEVSLTNCLDSVLSGAAAKEFAARVGPFLLMRWASVGHREISPDRHCRYVADISGGQFYSFEKNSFEPVLLPFRALWKDWDDYEENFSSAPREDVAKGCREIAAQRREWALKNRNLQDYCLELADESPHVVLFRRGKAWRGVDSWFALVRRFGRSVEILGIAEDRSNGPLTLYSFDTHGHLRWWSSLRQGGGGKAESHYEFDETGAIRRFVELDEMGRGHLRRNRWNKQGEMVGPELRPAFLAEARAVHAILTDARSNRNYDIVPDEPVPPISLGIQDASNAKVALEKVERERQERLARTNALRLAEGRTKLTEQEKGMMEWKEALEERRRFFEGLRHQTTGCPETAEHDGGVDMERARLYLLAVKIVHSYPRILRAPDARPKTLADLVAVRYPQTGTPLLPEGEQCIRDHWGRPYRYRAEDVLGDAHGRRWPVITSAGADGMFGTADDLTSVDWIILQRRSPELEGKASPR